MSLEVIGAGFGRCGTMSLRKALELLGYAPCYHMQVTLTHHSHMNFWVRARAGEQVDYRRFFRHYRATVDWPACEFWREILHVFPDAKIVLNVRDPQGWYDSMAETIWAIQPAFPWWFPRVVRQMHDDIIWNARFKGEFENRDKAVAAYRAHVEEGCAGVPPEQLLVYDVAEGWEPLCRFLDRPVPEAVAFPRLNDRRSFRRVIHGLRIAEWAVPTALLAAMAWVAWRLWH